jgi:hypothetical protein
MDKYAEFRLRVPVLPANSTELAQCPDFGQTAQPFESPENRVAGLWLCF